MRPDANPSVLFGLVIERATGGVGQGTVVFFERDQGVAARHPLRDQPQGERARRDRGEVDQRHAGRPGQHRVTVLLRRETEGGDGVGQQDVVLVRMGGRDVDLLGRQHCPRDQELTKALLPGARR